MEKLLEELCSISSVSGDEEHIAHFIRQKLSNICELEANIDGSLIANLGDKNSENKILFDAHMDQIGLIVTHIDKSGFIKFAACGGADPRNLYGESVIVHAKCDLIGIICSTPGHLKNAKDSEKFPDIPDLVIDIGTDDKEVLAQVSLGDRISFKPNFKKLLNNNFSSPSTDDRAGVCVMLTLAQQLVQEKLNSRVAILFSSQEEVGCRGAKVSAFKCSPNQAVSVDVSFAKQPGLSEPQYANLGEGPMIGIAPTLSKKISNTLIELAKTDNIPYQLEVMGGKSGTNADAISLAKSGVPCGLVSIPQRYMHSNIEVINKNDLENIVKLLVSYAKVGGIQSGN